MGNIRVSVKLAIGFSIIIVMTVVVALLGINNQRQQVEGNKKLELANRMQEGTQSVRLLSFDSRLGMDTSLEEEARRLLENLNQNNDALHSLLYMPRSIELSGQFADASKRIYQAFENLTEAKKKNQSALNTALEYGADSDRLIGELNFKFNGDVSNPKGADSFFELQVQKAVGDLAVGRKALAYASRGVVLFGGSQLQSMEDAYASIKQTIDYLDSRLHGGDQAMLGEIDEDIGSYVASVREIGLQYEQGVLADREMAEAYALSNQIVAGIVDEQNKLSASQNRKALISLLVVMFCTIVSGALISFYIIRQVTVPLRQAVEVARLVGEGNVSDIGTVINRRTDEFGVMLDALQVARENLRTTLQEITGATTQLSSSAEELSAVTEQTSAGVNSQREETEQVATAMNQMTATVHEVAQNAEQAAYIAGEVEQQAKDGNQVLQAALREIDHLAENVNQSALAMQRVNIDSESIGAVMTVINGIAEQTNLLALNAAIEAARAGEAGRGFAVVADEVRGLAQRTQVSTAEIDELINNLQAGSASAMSLMEVSKKLASDTLELARKAGGEIDAIGNGISSIQAMGQQIATAAEEQSSVAEEINRSIVNVNGVAEQSASAMNQTAAAAVELAELSQHLHGLVGRFKV